MQDRRQGAVDVDGKGLPLGLQRGLDALDEDDAVAGESAIAGHAEEERLARIDLVDAMAEAGQLLARGSCLGHGWLADSASDSDSPFARAMPAAIISMQLEPAPPCSSPTARRPAATAAESD